MAQISYQDNIITDYMNLEISERKNRVDWFPWNIDSINPLIDTTRSTEFEKFWMQDILHVCSIEACILFPERFFKVYEVLLFSFREYHNLDVVRKIIDTSIVYCPYPEFPRTFYIFHCIIIVDYIAGIYSESIDDGLIICFFRLLQPHFCRAEYRIKKVLEIHSFPQIFETVFLLIGRNMTLDSVSSEFLYLRKKYGIGLILEIEPRLQIFIDGSIPSPILQIGKYRFSEISISDGTLLEYSREKWLHDARIESCSASIFSTPHGGLDEDSVSVEEEVDHGEIMAIIRNQYEQVLIFHRRDFLL